MSAAYLDASALVKLFKREAESDALWDELSRWDVRASSELIVVEAICTARRMGGKSLLSRAKQLLKGLDLVPFGAAIRDGATAAFRPPLRAFDAVHLATALSLRDHLDVFIAYDSALCRAAKREKLKLLQPR